MDKLMTYGVMLLIIGIIAVIVSNLIHNIRKYGVEDK